jgi:glycerol-3-phosphate cytidylyltransferase-like family protein
MAPWLVYTNVYLYYLKPRLGDYVIVGVHNDAIVNQRRGMNLPIMNMHERVLSVLGCKVRRLCDVLLCADIVFSAHCFADVPYWTPAVS